MTLPLLIHVTALFLVDTTEAPKITDVVPKAPCEFVVLLKVESLGPY